MARGQWWEYLIPGHNVGLMVGDVYDSITGNSEKNAGTGVFGTRRTIPTATSTPRAMTG